MPATATFLYDGDCAFCARCVAYITAHIPHSAQILPWQHADLDELGLSAAECDAAVQWVVPDEPIPAGPEAIAALLLSSPLRRWRLLGRLLGLRLLRGPSWAVYRWISRNRHRLPGGTASCALPRA